MPAEQPFAHRKAGIAIIPVCWTGAGLIGTGLIGTGRFGIVRVGTGLTGTGLTGTGGRVG